MAKDMSKLLETYEGDAEEENEIFSEKPQRKKEKNKDEPEEEKENQKIKLDLKDRKILAILDEDSRLSNSQIAKRVGLSKPAIEYRLKRFEKNNVIFSFYTVIDFTKLGYSQYKLYFNFQNTDLEDEKKIIDYWKKDKGSVWIGQIRGGSWDLAVSLIAKSNFEVGRSLNQFMNKFSKFILEKDVLLTEYYPTHSNGILSEPYKIDNTDEKILKEIADNARINIVDLSEKLKLSRDIITYRLKKLAKDKIIIQYRCYLNLNNIGLNLYKIILKTKNFDEKAEKSLRNYLVQHKKNSQFLNLIGSWDIELEFETQDEDELYMILNKIRKEFSEIISDFDILRVTKIHKLNYFPF